MWQPTPLDSGCWVDPFIISQLIDQLKLFFFGLNTSLLGSAWHGFRSFIGWSYLLNTQFLGPTQPRCTKPWFHVNRLQVIDWQVSHCTGWIMAGTALTQTCSTATSTCFHHNFWLTLMCVWLKTDEAPGIPWPQCPPLLGVAKKWHPRSVKSWYDNSSHIEVVCTQLYEKMTETV